MADLDPREAAAAFLKERGEMMEHLLGLVGGPQVAVTILRRRSRLGSIGMRYENWLMTADGHALAYMLEEVTRDRMHLDCAVYDKPRANPLEDPAPLVEGEIVLH